MSEFIVIAPSDYTKVDVEEWSRGGITLNFLEDIVKGSNFGFLNEQLINAGLMPEGKLLHDIQITNGVDVWVKYDNAE